jgi:hypothetical protein
MAKTYTSEERKEFNRQLENMTDDQLKALELAGAKLLRESAKERLAENMRRYRQRIALAALNKGMIQADD